MLVWFSGWMLINSNLVPTIHQCITFQYFNVQCCNEWRLHQLHFLLSLWIAQVQALRPQIPPVPQVYLYLFSGTSLIILFKQLPPSCTNTVPWQIFWDVPESHQTKAFIFPHIEKYFDLRRIRSCVFPLYFQRYSLCCRHPSSSAACLSRWGGSWKIQEFEYEVYRCHTRRFRKIDTQQDDSPHIGTSFQKSPTPRIYPWTKVLTSHDHSHISGMSALKLSFIFRIISLNRVCNRIVTCNFIIAPRWLGTYLVVRNRFPLEVPGLSDFGTICVSSAERWTLGGLNLTGHGPGRTPAISSARFFVLSTEIS